MSRPWELCRVCSLISRISFRSRSKAGEIKFFLTSGPAVGDGERVYKCSPGAPAAAGAPARPCGEMGLPRQQGRAAPRRGQGKDKDERRQILPSLLRPGQPPARRAEPGAGAVPAASSQPCLAGTPAELGRPRPPPGKRGPRGHQGGSLTADGSPSLQQALIAKGQLKAREGR